MRCRRPAPDSGYMTTTDLVSRPVPRAQLEWLRRELPLWQAEGVLDADQGAAILGRYHPAADPGRRFSLARLLLSLGAAFVGVGLIWLVAANLDELPPLVRFAVVACLWLALLFGAEVLHERLRLIPSSVVGAVRLLAALAFGAVMFQAAQSLQVPAYEPALVGLWGAGALVHAYAVRATGPLLVGIATGTGWFVWQTLMEAPSVLAGVLCVAAGSVVATSLAALHERRGDDFAAPWRVVGALLALATLFTAALPFADDTDFAWDGWLIGGLAVAGLVAVAAVALGRGAGRLEPLGAVGVLVLSLGLVLWDAGTEASEALTAADWAHAGVSVAAYAGLAVGIAALGAVRDSWPLTALATAGLVVFTTFQSFAVFAQIIQGAWLFVVLGLIFLGTGYGFDRARRELAATLEGA